MKGSDLLFCRMQKRRVRSAAQTDRPGASGRERLVSRRILILANLLRRAAALRYRRLLRLAGVEWGLIAHVGGGRPQTLSQIANGMGLEKAQLSRTVSTLVKRGLVSKKINPQNNREVSISLTPEGLRHHRIILAAGEATNDRLLAEFPDETRTVLVRQIEHLTRGARELLQSEQGASATAGRDVASRPKSNDSRSAIRR
jgi:DNA-binding MarR family transcriptional regulator